MINLIEYNFNINKKIKECKLKFKILLKMNFKEIRSSSSK